MANDRSTTWRYGVCGLLLCATMLMYMDRLTLSQLATTICKEYNLSNERYGLLDSGFSYAFALGSLFFGCLADLVGPRWLYPLVVIGWSSAGVATAYAESIGAWLAKPYAATVGAWFFPGDEPMPPAYLGFMACRVALGFFESGHWPCALVTTQVIMARNDRSLGNSILQSGSALGSVITPMIVLAVFSEGVGGWRPPFVVIGCLGIAWIVPWLVMVRADDLDHTKQAGNPTTKAPAGPAPANRDLWRMFAVLVVVVSTINLPWQYFRNWLPMYLEKSHGYNMFQVAWLISAYYISAEIGCLGVGATVTWLTKSGWEVHRARLITFSVCAILTSFAISAAFVPSGPLLVLVLFVVAAGSLGLYPNYYSFTQELSRKYQGRISGALSTMSWVGSGIMQQLVGRNIDATGSYQAGMVLAGLTPLIACAALWLFWPPRRRDYP